MNQIHWNELNENAYNTLMQTIMKCFTENPSDKHLDWLNRVYDSIFIYPIFVNAIKESNYIQLDLVYKRVVRKTNKLNPHAVEYVPQPIIFNDTEKLIISMIDNVLN
jgi:hypothetical protein